MTSSTKNTIWALGVVAILGYLAWKLWPALSRAINKNATGSGSAAGASGASNAYPGYPNYENESAAQGNLLSQLLNALTGSGSKGSQIGTGGAMPSSLGAGSGGSSTNSGLASALVNLITNGENASDQMAYDSDYAVQQVTDGESIASEPIENFDVNQTAVDMPVDSTDYTDFDTNNYDAGSIDDSGY